MNTLHRDTPTQINRPTLLRIAALLPRIIYGTFIAPKREVRKIDFERSEKDYLVNFQ